MKTIWKYNIKHYGLTVHEIPKDAEILCLQRQNESVCLWILVDPANKLIKRTFATYGTGLIIAREDKTYIGTVQLEDFVWHIFERGNFEDSNNND